MPGFAYTEPRWFQILKMDDEYDVYDDDDEWKPPSEAELKVLGES